MLGHQFCTSPSAVVALNECTSILHLKIKHSLSEIQLYLGILCFYLLNLEILFPATILMPLNRDSSFLPWLGPGISLAIGIWSSLAHSAEQKEHPALDIGWASGMVWISSSMASWRTEVLFVPYSATQYQLYPQASFPPGVEMAVSHSWGFMLPHSLWMRGDRRGLPWHSKWECWDSLWPAWVIGSPLNQWWGQGVSSIRPCTEAAGVGINFSQIT